MSTVPTMQALAARAEALLVSMPRAEELPGRSIGLYGTGFLGNWAVDYLRKQGTEPAICFDGDPAKQGTRFKGLDVRGFSRPASDPLDAVLITARHAVQAIAPMLATKGVQACSFDGWYVANHFAQFADLHDHHFDDEFSRVTLRAVLQGMLTADRSGLHAVLERDQYFCLPQFSDPGRELYVDAGAYVGDSLERFIWANAGAFRKAWAFEPFARQCAALRQRVERLTGEWALDGDKIEIVQAGLSSQAATMSADTSSGQLQSIAMAEGEAADVRMVSLDEYLGGDIVTFIKADVEGMEMALLEGAHRTIMTCKPKLAICVYHYPCDIPQIAARIRGYVPEYKFALRHHSPQLMETVLYCWID